METITNTATGRPVSVLDLDLELDTFLPIGSDPEKTVNFMNALIRKVHSGEILYPADAQFRLEDFATLEGIHAHGKTLLEESRQRRHAVEAELIRQGRRAR